MLTRHCAIGLAAVCLVLGACSRDTKAAADIERIEQIPVQLTMKLRGDINLTLDKQVLNSSFIVRQRKEKAQPGQQLMGVENLEPAPVQGQLILAGLSILPFNGDGRYTVPAGSPADQAAGSGSGPSKKPEITSGIKVQWWPTSDINGRTEQFMRRLEPCKATVEEDGTRGRLFCPAVTDEQRSKRFSLEFVWDVPETKPGEGK